MHATHQQRGFTLIELLVVIAIIGILASVVISSLGSARDKGVDAAVQSNLDGIRATAELYSTDNSNTYTGACAAATASHGLLETLNGAALPTGATVQTAASDAGDWNKVTCHDAATTWVVEAPLRASANGAPVMWCVDNTGAAKQETANLAANATACA